MDTMVKISIENNGQLSIPLEANEYLNLQHNDWLKVSVQNNCIMLIPPKAELDEEFIADLIHAGILVDVKRPIQA